MSTTIDNIKRKRRIMVTRLAIVDMTWDE